MCVFYRKVAKLLHFNLLWNTRRWSTFFCHLYFFFLHPAAFSTSSLKSHLQLCAPLCRERKWLDSQVVHDPSTESGTFSITADRRDIWSSMRANLWVSSEPTRTDWFWLASKCSKHKVLQRHNNMGQATLSTLVCSLQIFKCNSYILVKNNIKKKNKQCNVITSKLRLLQSETLFLIQSCNSQSVPYCVFFFYLKQTFKLKKTNHFFTFTAPLNNILPLLQKWFAEILHSQRTPRWDSTK